MTLLQKLSAGISWFVAGIGGLVSLMVCFAAGMKAAPKLESTDAAIALALPLIGGFIAWLVLSSSRRGQTKRRYLLWTLPPICIAALSVLFVVANWLWSVFVW
jgi:hypothetical protein